MGAFQEILTNEDSVSLLSYDRLCEQGVSSLRVLESHCHLTDKSLTGTAGDLLRAPTRYPPLEQDFPKDLLSRVESIYAALLDRSII